MKRIVILLLALHTAPTVFSQDKKAKPDTMSIILNGEHITVPVPKEGNKTTINLEDSTSIIQISVGKTSKSRISPAVSSVTPAPVKPGKRISWFNEVEFGLLTIAGQSTVQGNDTAFGFNFSFDNTNSSNRATLVKLTPHTINPGFSAGFTIREKSRPIGNTKFNFITGSRFRYSRFTGKGSYDLTEVKATTVNGRTYYDYDSVYSRKTGEYKTVNSSYSLLFPFLVSTQLNKFTVTAGVNLSVNMNSSKISEGLKDRFSVISYMNPQIVSVQPVIKASRERTSLYFSFNLNKTQLGYGATKKIYGNAIYLGLAYKLY